MRDIPIIFSAPMVRALLDGRKTMTRRLLKPQTKPAIMDDGTALPVTVFHGEGERPRVTIGRCITVQELRYAPGDLLWVRENFKTAFTLDKKSMTKIAGGALDAGYRRPWCPINYLADGATDNWTATDWGEFGKGRPCIFMPRWASRLTLSVTAVKIERLKDISEADAEAEGVYTGKDGDLGPLDISARALFADLWRKLHGPESVDANPEVVAISFTVHKINIDAMPKAVAA